MLMQQRLQRGAPPCDGCSTSTSTSSSWRQHVYPATPHTRNRRSQQLQQQCRVSVGPEPPPRRRKPEWVRVLEQDADVDEDVAALLEGTDGDEDKIREKMRMTLERNDLLGERSGEEEPPRISFREVDIFDLWLWVQFYKPPSDRDRELLESVFKSWYIVGKLGGYNSQNLQVYYNAGDDQSYLDYNSQEGEDSMAAYLHELGELEFKGQWARVNLDMGTADELALDVLLNMLMGFSRECCGIKRICVGGENDTWPLPNRPQEEMPKVGIDPMRLPIGLDEELELLDELEEERSAAARLPAEFDPESMSLYSEEDWKRAFPDTSKRRR